MKLINGMDFVDDPQAVGKWTFFDVIETLDEFDSCIISSKDIPFGYKQVYFLPNGQGYWIFEGWKKGTLLVCHGGDDPVLCFDFSIKKIDKDLFMFIKVKEDNEEYIVVLKKQDSNQYTIADVKKVEDINIPFEPDDKILGTWKTVGFVEAIKDYDPKHDYKDDLWLKTATFYTDGTVLRKYFNCEWLDKWSNGVLLDQKKSVVSKYEFKEIDGQEYMFLEWKMGNYVYGGMPPEYYVFEKEN